jgi:ubiquinone biosynthesis monooxygenase Coq7
MRFLDDIVNEFDIALKTLSNKKSGTGRTYPPEPSEKNTEELTPEEKKLSIQMMRVNLAGEVAAQALYRGQSLVCKDAEIKKHLIEAGDEETDHLVWCKKRLDELEGSGSILNPVWYAGSFAIGAIFGRFGEKVSLGFVEETEKQVVAHIDRHLDKISPKDKETIEILKTMREDEDLHAQQAVDNGGEELKIPVKQIMRFTAKMMTSSSKYV